jgi:hypothetical protein
MEPWMASTEWSNMGCGSYASEFDCISGLGQSQANSAFQSHWGSWITQSDISQMQSYGLNTIRIPVGYWLDESIVYADSEHFPQGGLSHLSQVCGWASDAGLYIIIDMHGAPGAQVATNADTGQVRLPCIFATGNFNVTDGISIRMLRALDSMLTTSTIVERHFWYGSQTKSIRTIT